MWYHRIVGVGGGGTTVPHCLHRFVAWQPYKSKALPVVYIV